MHWGMGMCDIIAMESDVDIYDIKMIISDRNTSDT